MKTSSFDHVALWVADPDGVAAFLCRHLGMHVIERGDDFVLAGADAREGKVTLFAADGPRERGALGRIVLRVGNLNAAVGRLPDGIDITHRAGGAEFTGPEGVPLGLVPGIGSAYDLDHVVLRVPDVEATAGALATMGFERRDGALRVGDRSLRLAPGAAGDERRPLLNHLALLVDSAGAARREAERSGRVIEKEVDAENTLAVFVRGPAGITIEYVEHKPGFSLS